jgi:hypothetical protein
VQLTNAANGYVIADAVRIVATTAATAAPEIAVSVDGVNLLDGTGGLSFGSTAVGNPMTKTVTIQNTGTATLTLGRRTIPAGFVASAFGTTSLAAGQATTFTVTLSAASAGSYNGTLSFANNDTDENPFEIAVGGTVTTAVPTPGPQILDDGDTGFATSGSWVLYTQGGRGNDLRYAAAGTGTSSATWSLPITATGNYRVSTTWLLHTNRATNAPYSVYNGAATGTPLQVISVNQRIAPAGFTDSGTVWQDLGVFAITSGTLSVKLTNAANGYVIADAVRIEYIGPLSAKSAADAPGGTAKVPVSKVGSARGLSADTFDALAIEHVRTAAALARSNQLPILPAAALPSAAAVPAAYKDWDNLLDLLATDAALAGTTAKRS